MNNKWLEVQLTESQLELLETFSIVIGDDCSYILGLGEFYRKDFSDETYMTSDVSALPSYVISVYKEILENQLNKLNKSIDEE